MSREVVFSAGESMKVVEVELMQDGISEGAETFSAFLSLLPGANVVQIGDQYRAFATIIDRDGQLFITYNTHL